MSNVDAETGTAADAEATHTVASTVAAAPFVRLFGHADGDSVAACGLLAVALREQESRFASTSPPTQPPRQRPPRATMPATATPLPTATVPPPTRGRSWLAVAAVPR
ncbi:MAG: hypothetical protein A07HN63_00315 [uncultured archaeon A07HN63]|nr:MAG: hypothetical protein A07HN63_00315 [uncultured archaeon A07HN63]